jgi:SAM-dependent methyltransferase
MSGISLPWQFLCAFDTLKAALPCQAALRRYKDHLLGYERERGRERNTIRDGLTAISWLGECEGAKIVEIGSGWQPMLPVLFSLLGARVHMTDLFPLLRVDTFKAALDALREDRELISTALELSPALINHITREFVSLEERLQELRLEYLAPSDCQHLPLEPESVDIVISRAVLEHVPPTVVHRIFKESRRLLKPNGRMWHLIDHSDHWSHRDRSVSAVNFLKYPEWVFRLTCMNPQNYQNRLRHPEYVAMLESSGFALEREQRRVDPSALSALGGMSLAQRFRGFSPEDLATTSSILLALPR